MQSASVPSYDPGAQRTRRRIAENLTALGELYGELTHSLTPSPPSGGTVERARARGHGTPGIPLSTSALDVRDEIRGILASWAGVVRTERRIQAPARNTVALLAFLTHHAGWLARHESAEDVVAETDELVKAAWAVLSGRAGGPTVMGPCVRTGCPGTLVADVGSAVPSGHAALTCSADRSHTWSPASWHARRAAPAGPGRGDTGLTVQDICAGWGLASGTVYWLAHTHRWRRLRSGRRTYYHRGDVLATMDARDAAECAAHGA
ncbi:hypothetical protein [Streptomyces beigongshangae]|uniref:hypothetical protein n=1 Tax=Streptomyces beigongshangae TaxID=2841597 RepID=UPI001C854A7B|nr:hypothetical protein [Streptomyces sp. REN17]